MTIKEICLLVFLLGAAYVDGKEYRIPNKLILSALVCRGVLYLSENHFTDFLWSSLISELIAAALVLVATLVVRSFRSKVIGAGDFKLLLVMALYLGLEAFFSSLVYSSVVALIVITYLFLFKKIKKNHTIPLAPILASGVVVFFIYKQIFCIY